MIVNILAGILFLWSFLGLILQHRGIYLVNRGLMGEAHQALWLKSISKQNAALLMIVMILALGVISR